MIKAPLYNAKGEKTGDIELPEAVFDVPSNDTLLHQVYVAIAANLRQPIAHTKDRAERAGSGKKPWRQKGTGRARIGQVRAPHWRKGGIVFGPTKDRNFSKEANKKMRQKAVRIALSEKLRADKIRFVDAFSFDDRKTKSFSNLIGGLGISAGKRSLVGFAREERDIERMSRNIDRVENVLSENMSVYDLLQTEYLVLTSKSVVMLSERFAKEEKN
ncbi:MAG TPA: 50S ribosomal protein L4 [Candidatus Fimivivens sp.]|nr:50S ribosomal protein L4 [Candidatus Fimivivens sp.]